MVFIWCKNFIDAWKWAERNNLWAVYLFVSQPKWPMRAGCLSDICPNSILPVHHGLSFCFQLLIYLANPYLCFTWSSTLLSSVSQSCTTNIQPWHSPAFVYVCLQPWVLLIAGGRACFRQSNDMFHLGENDPLPLQLHRVFSLCSSFFFFLF